MARLLCQIANITVHYHGLPVFSEMYDDGNRISDGVYDARGNLMVAEDKIYHWNKQNQLAYVSNTAGEVLGKYVYDERGLRLMAVPPLPEAYIESSGEEIKDGEGIILECNVGQHIDATLTIKNLGDAILELTGSPKVAISGANADQFSILEQPLSPILPLGSSSFVIRFSPTSIGKKTAAISIANNDIDENPYDITLSGNLQPEIEIVDVPDGGTWDFGFLRIGQSQQWPFMIQNLGEADLLLNGNPRVQITGDELNQFSVKQQPDGVVDPAGYTFFVIRFSPVIEGPITAELSIENNDSDENPYTFTLMGTGQMGGMAKTDEADLDITFPEGSENLVAGETQTISWTGGQATQFVRIEYSTDNGSTYTTIAERAPNTGLYDWVVPSDLSPVCLIRMSDADGTLVAPRAYVLGFDLRMSPDSDTSGEGSQFTIRVAIPEGDKQTTQAADLTISFDVQNSTETIGLNFAGSASVDHGLFSGKWHHFQVNLDMENYAGSVAIDGQLILEKVPLTQLPTASDCPEVDIICGAGSKTKIWMDNLEAGFLDYSQVLHYDGAVTFKPIIGDAFDRYVARVFPEHGGWLISRPPSAVFGDEPNRLAADGAVLTTESAKALTSQTAGQIPEQGVSVQAGTIAEIDDSEHVSPIKSFRFEQVGSVSAPIIKKFRLPERLPYDISSTNFSIVSQDTELAQIMERMIAERKQVSATMPGTNADEVRATTLTSQSTASGSAATMSSLSASPVGNYYIYSFDGRLLSEYNIYGACLKDYVYMGSHLVAEYNPATSQYFYYAQDQIGSTRIVTNDSGAVVYAEAHDPYGGVQKTWPGNTFDPKRKFSDKERDEETLLDYFGARYYARGAYRWLSVDSVLVTERAIARSQSWNLYSFCENNPVTFCDPDGRVVRCSDEAAFEALKKSIGDDTLASKITWDKLTGLVTVEDIKSDNLNFISLKELVQSSQEFVVSLADSVNYLDATQNYKSAYLPLRDAYSGATVTPKNGRKAPMVRDSASILVAVSRRALDKSEQARTLAHELYGHAYLYNAGLPFLHDITPAGGYDKNGFVNRYIYNIQKRKY